MASFRKRLICFDIENPGTDQNAVLIGSSARLCASITASKVSSGIAANFWYRED